MAEYFAGGHLRFLDGEWRDDNGDVVEIREEKQGEWIPYERELISEPDLRLEPMFRNTYRTYTRPLNYRCSVCGRVEEYKEPYCHCGRKMNTQ